MSSGFNLPPGVSTREIDNPSDTTIWLIRIAGYGTFEFTGTEAEAEGMRAHKANWERGMGMKWRKDLLRESDKLTAVIANLFDQNMGVPGELVTRRAKALKAEASHV
jgi:hypothetical protein